MYKVVEYKTPELFLRTGSSNRKRNRLEVEEDYVPKVSSLRRTRATVQDIVLCNRFELFCTFTFNPQRINRYSFAACSSCMRKWLAHQQERSRSFGVHLQYLVIPEQHKDGAWHFHALIGGYKGQLKDSGLKTVTLRPIYNITSFRSGFTSAVPIDDQRGVSSYITKYISKDFVKSFNNRRFFCSRGLKRPIKTINSSVLRKTLPIFKSPVYENEKQFIYFIDK